MRVTMVKKRFADGSTCGKCEQAEEVLRRREVWDSLDAVVWADERDESSEGMQLARAHRVELAPFFVVTRDDGSQDVLVSTIKVVKLLKKRLAEAPATQAGELTVDGAEAALEGMDAPEIVAWTLETFGPRSAIAFSGAEDVVLVDMALDCGARFEVFCLDTGRLHAETYRFIERVRKHYGIAVTLMSPRAEPLQAFVRDNGLFSFYEDGHKACCGVRKVEPLRRALSGRPAWLTGQRRDQSPDTRAEVPVVQLDGAFGSAEAPLFKVNPLAGWSSQRVWRYIRDREVPFNELHERGFVSIGCEPCTRPVNPGQHEREGRWWWEEATKKECGLHLA